MKTINTEGITYIQLVPSGTAEWYYGLSYEHGDIYEAEEIFRAGHAVEGRNLILIHYPDGTVYRPIEKRPSEYCTEPVYLDGKIYILNVDFNNSRIQILRFGCEDHQTEIYQELPLNAVKDCYNLALITSPLTLTRQNASEQKLDIIWPEHLSIPMEPHDSFFLRDGDRLFFNRWYEEGEGISYRYWEETVIRSLDGEIKEILPGDVMRMPDGELWHLS